MCTFHRAFRRRFPGRQGKPPSAWPGEQRKQGYGLPLTQIFARRSGKMKRRCGRSLMNWRVYADLVLPGIEECQTLCGTGDPELAAQFYQEKGVQTVVVKEGAKGAFVKDRENSFPGSGISGGKGDRYGGSGRRLCRRCDQRAAGRKVCGERACGAEMQ